MKVLVGSSALKEHLPNVHPKDVDYFSDTPIPGAETFYDSSFEDYEWSGSVASLDELYTIKVSHSFWELRNGSWSKHMSYLVRMEEAEAKFLPELYSVLYPVWERVHGAKKANLEASPEDFFNSNVTRKYEHDSIHASVAFYDEPLFRRILRDGHEVAVSKKKFESLPHDDKIKLVQEEIFATALERRVIPAEGREWRSSYGWALKELITSYSKGWFPLFVVLNFASLNRAPFNYYDKMLENKDKLVLL